MVTRYTPNHLERMGGDHLYELEDGRLVERTPGAFASWVAGNILIALHRYFGDRKNWLLSFGVTFNCFPGHPDTVRRASVAFIPWDRLTLAEAKEAHCRVAPSLVADVLSWHDVKLDVPRRAGEWFEAGVSVYWVIDPEAVNAHVYRADGSVVRSRGADSLTAEELLPGFACPISSLLP